MSKFSLGRLVATTSIANRMDEDNEFKLFVQTSLHRYVKCDWGDTFKEDIPLNDNAVKTGEDRILAAYVYPKTGEKIWIITEWDRSYTTVLYPDEY